MEKENSLIDDLRLCIVLNLTETSVSLNKSNCRSKWHIRKWTYLKDVVNTVLNIESPFAQDVLHFIEQMVRI